MHTDCKAWLTRALGFVRGARRVVARATRAVVAFLGLGLGMHSSACTSEAEHVSETSRAGHALVHQGEASSRLHLLEALEVFSPESALGGGDASKRAAISGVGVTSGSVEGTLAANPVPRYVCENFEVRLNEKGQPRYKRLRKSWTQEDKNRFKKLVEMVAEEMEADPRLLRLWSLRESTYNPYAIHVLNPDLRAADRSWERHHWTSAKEAALREEMGRHSAKSKPYWKAKGELDRLFRFKDNRFFEDEVEYEVVYKDGTRVPERASRWSYGYGPFGFNPTYFLPVWDVNAPPWVFCNDDGIAAIVTAIWSARRHQRECRQTGYGESYETVNRRFSSGSCRPRPERAHLFRKRARGWGLNPDAKARLGKKWPEQDTDRGEIVRHMRARAEAKGLLSPHAMAGSSAAASH